MSNKVIVGLSGGLKSACLVAQLIEKEYEIIGVTFKHPHILQKELDHANWIWQHYNFDYTVIELMSDPLETIFYEPLSHQMTLTSLLTTYAQANNVKYIATSNCRNDEYGQFAGPIGKELHRMSGHTLQIIVPFIRMTLPTILTKTKHLNVPFDKTWSCTNADVTEHCLTCKHCVRRINAFKEAKMHDPKTNFDFGKTQSWTPPNYNQLREDITPEEIYTNE